MKYYSMHGMTNNVNKNVSETHDNTNENCKIFGLTYLSKSWKEVHQFAAHCVHCNEQNTIYKSLDALIYHFVKHHLRDFRYKCIYKSCSDEYKSYKELFIHMLSHSECDLKPFQCTFKDNNIECDYTASSKPNLIQHIQDSHFINVTDDINKKAQCRYSSYPVLAGTIRPQIKPQIINRKKKKTILIPNTKRSVFNATGIPKLRTNKCNVSTQNVVYTDCDDVHSIIFPYFQSNPLISSENTDIMAESGFYDDCVPPLIIPIVPAAFKASLHCEYTSYNDKYFGNPIKKPFYKTYDEISWRLDEPRDPHFTYHKELRLPPNIIYGDEKRIKLNKITPNFFLCKERVNTYCNTHKYWYKIDNGRMFIANNEEKKRERMLNKKRVYNENKKKWNRRRRKRRKRHLKRKTMVKQQIINNNIKPLNRMDILLMAAQNDLENVVENDYTDCTTCSDYDSSSSSSSTKQNVE